MALATLICGAGALAVLAASAGCGSTAPNVMAASGGAIGSGGVPDSGSGGNGSAGTGAGTGGGMPGSGGHPAGGSGAAACTPPDPSPLEGWATESGGTTGGGTATPAVVTTLAQLNAAVAGSAAAVVWVQGTISGVVKIGSNKTVVGVCGATLNGHVEISGSTNVILRNIAVVGYAVGNCALDPTYDPALGCSSGMDAISIQNKATHIWLDHCDISDGTDGNLDITLGADNVTVSWTKFHYSPRTDPTGTDSTGASGHRFSNLVGGDDNATGDAGTLNVTWHHNWWADNVVERQPRVRFGKNHLYNNLWSSAASSYCVRAGKDASILIENSVFSSVKNPQQFNSPADQATSFITTNNDVYNATSGSKSTGGGGVAFTMAPYTYAMDATTGLEAAIRAGAGPQ